MFNLIQFLLKFFCLKFFLLRSLLPYYLSIPIFYFSIPSSQSASMSILLPQLLYKWQLFLSLHSPPLQQITSVYPFFFGFSLQYKTEGMHIPLHNPSSLFGLLELSLLEDWPWKARYKSNFILLVYSCHRSFIYFILPSK